MWSGNIGLAIRNLVKDKEKFIEEVIYRKRNNFFTIFQKYSLFSDWNLDDESNGFETRYQLACLVHKHLFSYCFRVHFRLVDS